MKYYLQHLTHCISTQFSQGRGSRNPSTGPATDRSSFIYGGMEGGYAYIDSSYPRRPGDTARLSSMEFEPTGNNI